MVIERGANRDFVQLVDKNTGEVLESYWKEKRGKPSGRPPGKQPGFFRLWRTNWRNIGGVRKLRFYDAGVFFHLVQYLGWQTPWLVDGKTGRNLSETDIADLLELDVSNCRKVLKRLCDAGLLSISNNGQGRPIGVRLNPHLVFYGKLVKDLADVAEFDKSAWQPPIKIRFREDGVYETQLDKGVY
jgi:hypothetical protein